METTDATVEMGTGSSSVMSPRNRGGTGNISMRGSFERGRGRGIGRGHYPNGSNSNYMGRGGYMVRGGIVTTSGHQSRGGYVPRGSLGYRGGTLGISSSFQLRGGYVPRGGGGVRGAARMPLYTQVAKQHTGVDNNKTVSPMPTTAATTSAQTDDRTINEVAESSVTTESSTTISVGQTSANANNSTAGHPTYRGSSRGRGLLSRGVIGRGGHLLHSGSNLHAMHNANSMPEHIQIRRGTPSRGRAGYGMSSSMTRPPLHQAHVSNNQMASVTSLKRGAPGGPPGPKRGRYEGGPYSQRAPIPKYHQPHHMNPMQQQPNYGISHQASTAVQSHHSYLSHEQQQVMDPYAHQYSLANTQTSYNGYGQNVGYSNSTTTALSHSDNGYGPSNEYDHTQYQSYSAAYGGTQDTRYQSYGQDYTQQYGAPAVDYNTSQNDYSHQNQPSYDERNYAGYDNQSYQQSYSNSTGYY